MPTTQTTQNVYDILQRRGLVAQTTDADIRQRLSKPVVAYIGFDPTADSLHVGSLVPIMALAHMQRCGHKPIIVIGGATALVGDPSGKTDARQMLQRQQIDTNAKAIARQIERIVRFDDSPTGAIMLNNADWLCAKSWIDMLRDIGSHFSVGRMLSMESVKGRLDSGGISYLEFSYMVMQAYDFLHLFKEHNCTVQMGGQDQWGNIVMGIELGRRIAGAELAGLTFPLVTKADGGKFGKSETGNVWLDAKRTSPYEFYQFWRNVADSDVAKFLGYFTFIPMDEIDKLAALTDKDINQAKELLGYEVTKLIHGQTEAQNARDSAKKAFSATRDVTGNAIPNAQIKESVLRETTVSQLIVQAGFANTNSQAKRLIKSGGVYFYNEPIKDIARPISLEDLQSGSLLLRVGKKRLFRFDVHD